MCTLLALCAARFFYLKMGAVNTSNSFHVATVIFLLVFELWVRNEKPFQVAPRNDHFVIARGEMYGFISSVVFSSFTVFKTASCFPFYFVHLSLEIFILIKQEKVHSI